MTLPGWRDWAFALKTYAAAMLALYLALWIDLPRPYWALGTVYITSQVLSGATRAKAVYRVCGTVLGAAVSVVLVPNLVNAPILLSLAVALWVALCLYVSLLDRTPASYLPMLGRLYGGPDRLPGRGRSRSDLRHGRGARRGDLPGDRLCRPRRHAGAAAIGRPGHRRPAEPVAGRGPGLDADRPLGGPRTERRGGGAGQGCSPAPRLGRDRPRRPRARPAQRETGRGARRGGLRAAPPAHADGPADRRRRVVPRRDPGAGGRAAAAGPGLPVGPRRLARRGGRRPGGRRAAAQPHRRVRAGPRPEPGLADAAAGEPRGAPARRRRPAAGSARAPRPRRRRHGAARRRSPSPTRPGSGPSATGITGWRRSRPSGCSSACWSAAPSGSPRAGRTAPRHR